MNSNTGQLYTTTFEIESAKQRGESLVEVSPKVARIVRAGTRAIAARKDVAKRRRKGELADASRRRNRR